jgi:membrane fusion protein (multidrug efflux system)
MSKISSFPPPESAEPLGETPLDPKADARAPARRAPEPTPPPVAPVVVAAPTATPAKKRSFRRMFLLVGVPLIVAAGGLYFWLGGGRYVSTDNSYIGADKVMITPQVLGTVAAVNVVEGQHVKVGDKLFEIDPEPYRNALTLAKARVEAARLQYENAKANITADDEQIAMSREAVRVRQADYDRKTTLVASHISTQVDVETSQAALIQARQILAFVQQLENSARVQLGGSPDAPLDEYPPYVEAKAQVADAERNLRNTVINAPIAGVATQVTQIQLGRFIMAGSPIFAVISDKGMWVDSNPKESDLTYVVPGQKTTFTVDTYPDKVFHGRVGSIAPGTGAQFAILPPQNASGNWVKVVQRIPLRIEIDPDQDTTGLRAGMSTTISIDTGRVRSLSGIVGDLKALVGLDKAKAATP